MMCVLRGAKRTAKPDIFISHSSRDKSVARLLAKTLNYCCIDAWLDEWELEVGQSLTDEIAKGMNEARYIAILITENYNQTVWTKTEYRKALAREQKEGRTVMLPLIMGDAEIPDFLEDKIYIDLRRDYLSGVTKLVGMVHEVSNYRISLALDSQRPKSIMDVWDLLESIGFEPYVVLGKDDFDEILLHGGQKLEANYATFNPDKVLRSPAVSRHVKEMIEVFDKQRSANTAAAR